MSRDVGLDFSKAFGLVCIFLAHSGPPAWLASLRNFDVVLMVAVSGAVYGARPSRETWPGYWGHRLGQLILPTWVFLTFLISFFFAKKYAQGQPLPLLGDVLNCFLLDADYVWIIRVFVLVALAAPFLGWMKERWGNIGLLLPALFFYGLDEAVLEFGIAPSGAAGYFFEKDICYLAPYGLVFALGMASQGLDRKGKAVLGSLAIALFALFSVVHHGNTGAWPATQDFKYPPRFYYLSYGVAVFFLLQAVLRDRFFQHYPGLTMISSYLSRHSLRIYLAHTLVLGWGVWGALVPFGFHPFLLKWVLLMTVGVGLVWTWDRALEMSRHRSAP